MARMTCKTCGSEFETQGRWARYCPECKKTRRRELDRIWQEKRASEKATREATPDHGLADMNQTARAHGLSYGKWVAELRERENPRAIHQ